MKSPRVRSISARWVIWIGSDFPDHRDRPISAFGHRLLPRCGFPQAAVPGGLVRLEYRWLRAAGVRVQHYQGLRPSQGGKEIVEALRDAPRQAAEVAVPIAAIGLVIAVAVQSNLALKFAGSLMALSEGSIYASLALAMLGCIIMGMGLPTVAVYIIGAVLFVPAIQDLGVAPLAAHFFIFYYCVLSMVTPPVALASFAAAAVGKAPVGKTSLSAFGLSLVAFFVPFGFVLLLRWPVGAWTTRSTSSDPSHLGLGSRRRPWAGPRPRW